MTIVVSIVLKDSLLQHIDNTRGDIPRSRFIAKVLENALHSEMTKESTRLERV